MMNDPDLQRPPTSGDVRVLVLPSGGTIEIPMPRSKSRSIAIKPPSRGLSDFAHGSSVMPIVIGVLVGAAIGGAVVWYVARR
jgi:hypothetical protein